MFVRPWSCPCHATSRPDLLVWPAPSRALRLDSFIPVVLGLCLPRALALHSPRPILESLLLSFSLSDCIVLDEPGILTIVAVLLGSVVAFVLGIEGLPSSVMGVDGSVGSYDEKPANSSSVGESRDSSRDVTTRLSYTSRLSYISRPTLAMGYGWTSPSSRRSSSRPASMQSTATTEDLKLEVMCSYIYHKQCGRLWVREGAGDYEGVLIRKSRGTTRILLQKSWKRGGAD